MAPLPVQFLIALALGALISTTWIAQRRLLDSQDAIFLPTAFRFLLGSAWFFFAQLITMRRLPQISLRLFHSALAIGVLFLGFSSAFHMMAMKVIPSSAIAMGSVSLPLWLAFFDPSALRQRLAWVVVFFLGLCLYLGGGFHGQCTLAQYMAATLIFLIGLGMLVIGKALSKKYFWIHSAIDLNIWSGLIATVLLVPCAFATGEFGSLSQWQPEYWGWVAYLGLVLAGIGGYVYRHLAFRVGETAMPLLIVLVPVGAMVWGAYTNEGIPDFLTMVGGALCIASLLIASRKNSVQEWMTHYLSNTSRQGDRLAVDIKGFVKPEHGEQGNLRIISLSLGGIGFESNVYCPVADKAVVTISLGKSQVTFDTKVAFASKLHTSKDYTWTGGLAFQNLADDTRQILVEFLAKMGHPNNR